MADKSQLILSRVYATFLARAMTKKFVASLDLTPDMADTALEYLTETVSAASIARDNAALGMYALRLAGVAVLDDVDTPETENTFNTIRARARDMEYENALSGYVWTGIAGYTKATVLIQSIMQDTNEVARACRAVVDDAFAMARNPVGIKTFKWGALADPGFANVALETLYNRTGFPNPNVHQLSSALSTEIDVFSSWHDSIRSDAARVLTELHTVHPDADSALPGDIVSWFYTARAYVPAIPMGQVSDIAAISALAEKISTTARALSTFSDQTTDENQSVASELAAAMTRLAVALYGMLQYQRVNQFKDVLVLALDTSDAEVPGIIINGDNESVIIDPEQRKRLIMGISYYAKSVQSLNPKGMTIDFFNTSLTFYIEKAEGQAFIDSCSEERNLYSRGRNLIVPILQKFIYGMAEKLPNSATMGNLDALVNQVFGLMTTSQGDDRRQSPHNKLAMIIGEMSGSEVIQDILRKYLSETMCLSEATAQCFVDGLVSDFFIEK